MRKKFLSYLAIFSLIMGLFVMGQTNTIYADNTKLNPDDMESILNDISSVGKAWESMGFQSQEISEIMQLPRKNSKFLVYFLNFPEFTGFPAHQHLCNLRFSLIFSLVRKL